MGISERVDCRRFPVEHPVLKSPADVARKATATDAAPKIVFVICILAVASRLIFINQPYILSRSSDRAVYAGRAASLLFLEQAFNPRNTQMNANRKELVLDFAKLSGCDTSSYRFGSNAALDEKRCEDAPHSKSTSCESLFRFVSIRVVRGQQDFSKAV